MPADLAARGVPLAGKAPETLVQVAIHDGPGRGNLLTDLLQQVVARHEQSGVGVCALQSPQDQAVGDGVDEAGVSTPLRQFLFEEHVHCW